MTLVRRFREVNSRNDRAMGFQFAAVPVAGHGLNCVARWAEKMLPPDTDVMVSIFDRIPSSLSRPSAPT